MPEPSSMLSDGAQWLVGEWSEKLCVILASMADQKPTLGPADLAHGSEQPPADGMVWSQCFAVDESPSVWVITPSSTAVDLGRRTLEAAGVEQAGIADYQNTYSEILNQAMSALGQSLSVRLDTKASATEGETLKTVPEGLSWSKVLLNFGGVTLAPIWLSTSDALLERLAAGPVVREKPVFEPLLTAETADAPITPEPEMPSGNSRTFDLLLDVNLPVSISFGRTFLPIKDVLKLNTGSIVELDRTVSEPVEVIVNNCVIARGEVVVVEGNYGVRIQQIASRYDRLRTGTASAQPQTPAANKL